MRTREQIIKVNRYADEILDLIDHADDFTRSDLQGIVDALVWKILTDTAT